MRLAVTHLRSVDPVLAGLIARVGRCGLTVNRTEEPY